MRFVIRGAVFLVLGVLGACAGNVAPISAEDMNTIDKNSAVILVGVLKRGNLDMSTLVDDKNVHYSISTNKPEDVMAFRYRQPIPGKFAITSVRFGITAELEGEFEAPKFITIDKPGIYYYFSVLTINDWSYGPRYEMPDILLPMAHAKYPEIFERLKPVNFNDIKESSKRKKE